MPSLLVGALDRLLAYALLAGARWRWPLLRLVPPRAEGERPQRSVISALLRARSLRAGFPEASSPAAHSGIQTGQRRSAIAGHERVERLPEHANSDPVRAHVQSGAQRFRTWVEELRAGDETFAEASGLYPPDVGEWQAAVYLLSGCPRVWRVLGPRVIERTSIPPVVRELERPTPGWSASELAAIEWAACFWGADRAPPRVPYMVEEALFRRWIAALHLRQRLAPR